MLPQIRQELALHPAPPAADGSPCWHLHDPPSNKFYLLGWAAFEILSRWELGNADAIVQAVHAETTLQISSDTVQSVADFLERNQLFETYDATGTGKLQLILAANKLHWAKWLLHNYLFFRIPFLRPDEWLGKHVHRIRPLLSQRFWWIAGAFAAGALIMVARQWEQLVHGFNAFTGWQTLLAFGIALSIAKMAHELGHAFVAKHHGCKVPTMGVAFLVMWPVLYTDTNEAWKLQSNRARFQISIAGMATELIVAIAATWLWILLPDGSVRSAVLYLATTSWVMTLLLNASPFMRFDGYFLLADWLGMPNLHSRSFAFGRWWMREKLFELGAPQPEQLPAHRVRFMIGFAYATWLYRLTLFLSIALLVYHAFFKLLGIVLLLVEIGWFIVRPLLQEVEVWWEHRHGMRWNTATRRSLTILMLVLVWLAVPWQIEISAPAILSPYKEQSLYAPYAGVITSYPAADRAEVTENEVLIELSSPDLLHKLRLAQINEASLRTQLEQQPFSEKLLMRGDAMKNRHEEATAELAGLTSEMERMTLRVPFSGEILYRGEDLQPGTWVNAREPLLSVADRSQSLVEVFVSESDLDRLQLNDSARFIPEAPEFGRYDCSIADIERINLTELDDPIIASIYGGVVPARLDKRGALTPALPYYRVKLARCSPGMAPLFRIRGTAHLEADGRSLLASGLKQVAAILIRESGF